MTAPLAAYALASSATRGRRHSEPRHPYRDPFARDRDRVIHSRAFRRLEDKTQVFTERRSDHFRNRLTHTIEVAQITRTIASELALNSDLAETLALVHDIGHPPFGHAGERILDELLRREGLSFDHNLHALRRVEYLEHRYPAFRGLNLTYEVREGIIKHSRDWKAGEHPELAEYQLDLFPPLEAQLIDLADEIAYTVADIDDGVESGILTVDMLRERLPLFARFDAEIASEYPRLRAKVRLLETLKRMLDYFVSDVIAYIGRSIAKQQIASVEEVRTARRRIAAFSGEVDAERAHTKQFLYDALYFSAELRAHKVHGEHVIEDLFAFWMQHPQRLPTTYRQMAGVDAIPEDDPFMHADPLPRVISDYIAGMTDSFCLMEHQRFIR